MFNALTLTQCALPVDQQFFENKRFVIIFVKCAENLYEQNRLSRVNHKEPVANRYGLSRFKMDHYFEFECLLAFLLEWDPLQKIEQGHQYDQWHPN